MLNIINKKNDTFKVKVYMTETCVAIRLPKVFEGRRFSLLWDEKTVVLQESKIDGAVCALWNAHSPTPKYKVSFSKGWLPFELFHMKPVEVEAYSDGKAIYFEPPVFEEKTPKKARPKDTPGQDQEGNNFDDLRNAIERVNVLAMKHNCELFVKDNILNGTINL